LKAFLLLLFSWPQRRVPSDDDLPPMGGPISMLFGGVGYGDRTKKKTVELSRGKSKGGPSAGTSGRGPTLNEICLTPRTDRLGGRGGPGCSERGGPRQDHPWGGFEGGGGPGAGGARRGANEGGGKGPPTVWGGSMPGAGRGFTKRRPWGAKRGKGKKKLFGGASGFFVFWPGNRGAGAQSQKTGGGEETPGGGVGGPRPRRLGGVGGRPGQCSCQKIIQAFRTFWGGKTGEKKGGGGKRETGKPPKGPAGPREETD